MGVRVLVGLKHLTGNYDSPRQIELLDADEQVISGLRIDPERVNVSVPIISSAGIKRVPVVPSIIGEPASGYVVTELSVEPQFVRLAGGSGSLENVQSITTEQVNIIGASRTISHTVKLREPETTPLLLGEPISATVTVRIAPIARPFKVTLPIPVQLVDIAPGLLGSLNPTILQVTLSGTVAQLSALDTTTLAGSVSARGLNTGIYTIEPIFVLPPGVALAGSRPKVTLTLRAPPSPTPQPLPTSTAEPPATTAPAQTETAAPPTLAPAGTPAETPSETPGASATPKP